MQVIKDKKKGDNEAQKRGDYPMQWQGHLEELRSRLLRCLIAIVIFFLAALAVSDHIFTVLLWPFKSAFDAGLRLNYSYMGESIVLTMQCALFASLFLTLPYIVTQVWAYVKPALALKLQRSARPLFISALILFYLGSAFSFFLLLPASVGMIIRFSKETIASFISSTNYISFLFTFCAGSGILFEMPVALTILAMTGAISPQTLIRKRKYVIVGIWILAAIMTPPDILSQTLVAIPLMILYELSLLLVGIICRKKLREQAELAPAVNTAKPGNKKNKKSASSLARKRGV